jgi:hypothetical protein
MFDVSTRMVAQDPEMKKSEDEEHLAGMPRNLEFSEACQGPRCSAGK